MLMRYEYLSEHPTVFQSTTGLSVSEFDHTVAEVARNCEVKEWKRLVRPDRFRALEADHAY